VTVLTLQFFAAPPAKLWQRTLIEAMPALLIAFTFTVIHSFAAA
jgi:hypothetical protein